MQNKPSTASGYSANSLQLIRATNLYIATKLGDLRDDLVIVGGLVPGLLIPDSSLPIGHSAHVGTMDIDLGLAVSILNEERYHELCERLKSAGFQPDTTDAGKQVNQRWQFKSGNKSITVDFLIPPTLDTDSGGRLRNLEKGFAAIITPALDLAFRDRKLIRIDGTTINNEKASREIWVCEAGAYVVLKALAFDGRGENKDAYDLIYILQNYGTGVGDVFERMKPLLPDTNFEKAIEILSRDFSDLESIGIKRFAEFLGSSDDDALRADAAAAVRSLIKLCSGRATAS